MNPIVTPEEAKERYNLELTEESLVEASDRARGFLQQDITSSGEVIVYRSYGPMVTLPQRPVTEIVSVTSPSGYPARYEVRSPNYVMIRGRNGAKPYEVRYKAGYAEGEVPDGLKAVICAIAKRIQSAANLDAATSNAVAAGVTQETAGTESVSYGFAGWQALSDLTASEMRALRRYFPVYPRTHTGG